MEKQTKAFVKNKFSNYYKSFKKQTVLPSSASQREFGFILFDGKTMIRHKNFKNLVELKNYLTSSTPSDAYYSSATYQYPEENMEKKGWLGADLVFDIDADHIPTPCRKIHDSWTCTNCKFSGKGLSPEECPICKQTRFNSRKWICDSCLESARSETIKLLEILINDLGFSENQLQVFFSGNRGYHVHVETESIRMLKSIARKEIVDYITGVGLKPELHGFPGKDKIALKNKGNIRGWRGRLEKGNLEFFETSPEEKANAGLNKQTIAKLNKNEKISQKIWLTIVEWIMEQKTSKIDTVVTTDIHRLIRLPNSLHGKTGFTKKETSIEELHNFDPLQEAIIFNEDEVKVSVSETPQFRIRKNIYGPYKQESIKLPMTAAIFLFCKGVAELRE